MSAFLCLSLCLAMTVGHFSPSEAAPTDPIPGCDVKVGRKPPGGNAFIAETVTGKDGMFEFKDMPAGDYSYFLELGLVEKGERELNFRIEDIMVVSKNKGKKPMPVTIEKQFESAKYGWVDIQLTYDGSSLRGTVSKSSMDLRGIPVNTSRSNIKTKNN